MIELSINGMITSNAEVKAVRADWKIQEAIIKVFPFRILFNRRNVTYSICDNFNFYDERLPKQIFGIDTLIDKFLARLPELISLILIQHSIY